jgi:hypothetical protein
MLGYLIQISSGDLLLFVALGLIVLLGIVGFVAITSYAEGYQVGLSKGDRSGREAERQRIESLPKPEPERQVVYVARKPLTAEQLEACKATGGKVCPRCTENEDISIDGFDEESPNEKGEATLDVECNVCSEKWRLVLKVDRVEVVED